MGLNDKHNNNAAGKDPVYGAIFIANSESKHECFKRRLFGLPSSYIPFVEKINKGMALFLFENENKLLHGVFEATCDGRININPKAFTSLGRQCPAQVEFRTIWECKPLPEKIFRDAIKENYFSPNMFNFGLSENQVRTLLDLFSMKRLEPEIPRRRMSRADDMTSERYPVGEVGRSVGHGMLDESVQNDRVLGDKSSPILMHNNYQGDYSALYNGFSADDILVNKQRSSEHGVDYTSGYVNDYYLPLKDESRLAARNNEDYIDNYAAKLTLDTANGYVGDYLARKDDNRFTSHENNDYMGSHVRPYTVGGGYANIPSDDVRVHGDVRSSISDRLMGEDLSLTGQRMIFSEDIHSLRDSNVDLPVFYNKTNLEQSSLVEKHRRSTSAMIHPFHLNTSCATQGAECSIPYDSDASGLNFRPLPSFGINNGSESITERLSPSTNCRRNSTIREPQPMHTELKYKYRWDNIGDCFSNSVSYGSNRDCMPFSEAQNSDQFEARSIPSFKSSSAPISSDIGNSGRTHEPFSSLFHNHKSYLDNNVHPMALQEYPSHDITLPMNNETLCPDVPLANWDHFQVQYDDSLDHGYDIGCYGDSQNSNHGHPKKKSSVFSRISFAGDVNKRENGNNTQNEEYGSITSVDEVMEMVRQSHNHRLTKTKPMPNQRNNAETLRRKTQINSQRKKNDCFENALEHSKEESLRNETQISSQRKKRDIFENALEHNKDESLRNKTQISSLKKKKRESSANALEHNEDESLRNKTQISSLKKKKRDFSEYALEHNEDESLRNKTQISSMKKKRDCFENALDDLNMDSTTVTGGNPNTTAKVVDFKRRSKVRNHSDEIERSSDESKKSENLVIGQQNRRKLIRPNFNKSASFEDKDIDLGGSRNSQLPLPNASRNHEDVIGSGCTLVNQCGNDGKTDAEVPNITDQTQSEGKNSSPATEFICSGGEKANVVTLPALIDGSECADNKNHQKVLSSVSCSEESFHNKEGSCMMDNVEAASLEKESLHAICQDKANVGTLPELNDGSECADNRHHQKVLSSASCNEESYHTNEGSCMVDNVKAASLKAESLPAIRQEKANAGTFPALSDGSECTDNENDQKVFFSASCNEDICHTKESLHTICQEKVNVGTLRALIDGSECAESECADDKNQQKILSSASWNEESNHTKEGSCMVDNLKEASLKIESLHAICQEKAITGTLPGLNDGSECADNKNHQKVLPSTSWNEESSHTKEGSCMMVNVKATSLKTESLHAICQEKTNVGTIPDLSDGSECADIKNHQKVVSLASCNEDSSHTKEGSCMMDNIKSTSLETESLNAICQENNADKTICADRCINANDRMPKDCVSFSIEARDGSECLGNSGNEKAPIETCHIEACM